MDKGTNIVLFIIVVSLGTSFQDSIPLTKSLFYNVDRAGTNHVNEVTKPASNGLLVVGGIEADPHQFPYLVNIQTRNYHQGYDHYCGGVIYDSLHILTAAHCVYGIHPKNFRIVAGDHELFIEEGTEQRRDISGYVYHPNYDSGTWQNDIAIITLDAPFDLNDQVQTIFVPVNKTSNTQPKIGRTAGWGSDGMSPVQPKLFYADLTIFSQDYCVRAYEMVNDITEGMICAGDENERKGSCNGDSGGPLICRDSDSEESSKISESRESGESREYLCGLVSWGMVPCGMSRFPTVFTNVAHYGQWLYDLLPELLES